MSIWGTIKEIAYGSIDQRLDAQQKLTYGFVGLIIAIAAQVMLADWLIPSDGATTQVARLSRWVITNRALLNIIVFPFQLLGIYSLMYVVQGATKYPFVKESFWNLETEKYVPFFIRARTFMYQPIVIIFIISEYLGVYIDFKTGYVYRYFWFVLHNGMVILAIFIVRWLKIFLEKFENAIGSIKHLLPDEIEFKKCENKIRNEVFNCKEIVFILIIFMLVKLIDVYYSDGTWKGGAPPGYKFPLTAIWWSFSVFIVGLSVGVIAGSVVYVYTRVDSILQILKKSEINIFLFDSDGYAGLGKIKDFISSFLAKILLLILIFTLINSVVIFKTLQTAAQIEPTFWSTSKMALLTGIIITNLVALILFYPLMKMRNIIKRKKEKERELLLDRIKQKEEAYLKRCLKNEELQEIEHTFSLIKHIDAVPEWGIGYRQWFSLLVRFLLTNGVALQTLQILIDFATKK